MTLPEAGPRHRAADDAGDLEISLRPTLQELERQRRSRCGAYLIRIALAVMATVLLCTLSGLAAMGALGAALQDFDLAIYVIPPLGAAVGLGYWADRVRRDYISAYKMRVLPVVAGAYGDFRYDEAGGIDVGTLRTSELAPDFDDCRSEDMFAGSYKGVDIELAEIRLTREENSGNDDRTVPVFKGLVVLLSMRKRFAGRTLVRRDAGTITNWLCERASGLERITLEDPEFEEHFAVYGTDQIEARYLLTPAFMERLTALAGDMGDGHLQAAFYGEQLLVLVPNSKNLFEPPSIFTSVLKDTGVTRIARELGDVLSMIDTLKLDEQTGL